MYAHLNHLNRESYRVPAASTSASHAQCQCPAEAADAGASSSLAEEQVDQDEDAEGDAGGEEDDEAVEDDMQLAWENLEVARQIYQSHESTHASELASQHLHSLLYRCFLRMPK